MKHLLRLVFLSVLLAAQVYAQDILLAGTSSGLFRVNRSTATAIWNSSSVRKILRVPDGWYLLTGSGVIWSRDLATFQERNNGLPVKTLKTFTNAVKDFALEIQELKDLKVHPSNPSILVTSTKDSVYLTRDGGLTWQNIGMSAATAGSKAVAVLDLPDSAGVLHLTVLLSHPIYGVAYKQPDARNLWVDINDGLAALPTVRWPDEVADLAVGNASGTPVVYASQTFMGRLYRLNWQTKQWMSLWVGTEPLDTIESLVPGTGSILAVTPGALRDIPLAAQTSSIPAPGTPAPGAVPAWSAADSWIGELRSAPGTLNAAWVPASRTAGKGNLSLAELWLLKPVTPDHHRLKTANGKTGIYIPVHQAATAAGFAGHLKTITDNRLNMLVIDMKDDYGLIRYNSRDPLVTAKGTIRPAIDLDTFIPAAKEKGVFLVARIVVFKDRSLSRAEGGRYAIWDRTENKAWQGYRMVEQKIEAAAESGAPATERVRQYYDEHWVDPYSEEVWQYNIAVARELIARGFDEIQFDYIRFPTDGVNLNNATYRWQDKGMDKESALMSFLSYARREISAPISIDIYGANGWYRTGTRTGQDVELLARYVDVICPMFYPSHFEQGFLAHSPASERPYRIYYYGSYRNLIIARNRVLVRSWTQAFYLPVSYDRTHYNNDYVQRQIFGIRDSVDQGYTYWNNSGRYGDIRPDLTAETVYPWPPNEGAESSRRPVFGGR